MKPSSMKPEDMKAWRDRMGYARKEAADRLGVSIMSMRLYEYGRRSDVIGGGEVKIPLSVTWGCTAIEAGLVNPWEKGNKK